MLYNEMVAVFLKNSFSTINKQCVLLILFSVLAAMLQLSSNAIQVIYVIIII